VRKTYVTGNKKNLGDYMELKKSRKQTHKQLWGISYTVNKMEFSWISRNKP